MTILKDIDARAVCEIFMPFGGIRMALLLDRTYEDIVEDINNGILALEVEDIRIFDLELPPKRGRETDIHRQLKANAGKLLSEMGEDKVTYEKKDFSSDVFGETLKIRVECDSTNGKRLYDTLWMTREFWVLQYPYEKGISHLYIFKINHRRLIEVCPEVKDRVDEETLSQFLDE